MTDEDTARVLAKVSRASRKTRTCEQCGANLTGEIRNPYTGESLAHDPDCPWYGRHDD